MLIFLIPILVLSGCGAGTNGDNDPDFIKAKKLLNFNADKYDGMDATGELIDGVRHITLNAYQFYFEPELIIVNKGEKIRLTINAMDIPHGFEIEGYMIPGYDIDTVIRKGAPMTIEFTADESGVWEFICTIFCGFGHSTMKGIMVIR